MLRPSLLVLAALALAACAEVNGSYYPSCGDVYRPELWGKIVCHMPRSEADAQAADARTQANRDMQHNVQRAIENAERSERHEHHD